MDVDGRPADPNAPSRPDRHPEVTPQYFETFGIPLVKGRTFQEADWTGEPAVVLNESAERILFAGERALGRRIQPAGIAGRARHSLVHGRGVYRRHPKRSRPHR